MGATARASTLQDRLGWVPSLLGPGAAGIGVLGTITFVVISFVLKPHLFEGLLSKLPSTLSISRQSFTVERKKGRIVGNIAVRAYVSRHIHVCICICAAPHRQPQSLRFCSVCPIYMSSFFGVATTLYTTTCCEDMVHQCCLQPSSNNESGMKMQF